MIDPSRTENQERINLTRACMMHVPFDGWSKQSLKLAAKDCGIDEGELSRILPRGVEEAVEIYAHLADQDMVLAFDEAMSESQTALRGMTAKIKLLILLRLEQASSHKEVVRKTLQYLRKPSRIRLSQSLLYNTIDRIWRVAGDESTDFSFYTKRGLLGAIYSATLLYFLGDNSGSMDNTSNFLDRRLREISVIPRVSKPLKKQSEFVITAMGKTFSSIAKNISQKMAKRGY
jgi:ubiquinone biosynthesis protein COQ9